MGNIRVLAIIILMGLISPPLAALDQAYVKRGTPERRGRGWAERVEFGAPVREGGRLILRADVGTIVLKPGTGDRLEGQLLLRAYTGNETAARRLLEGYQLSVRPLENGGAYVTGQATNGGRQLSACGVEFEIKFPQRFNLDVETQGGDIGLDNPLQGEARLTTAGGDIHAADLTGPLRAETAGGSITLGKVGSRVEASTAGGSIHVGDVKGDAALETSGGEIGVGQVEGTLRAETAGGDVVIAGAGGSVVAQSAGGQIQIGSTSGSVRAESAGGSIRCQGARGRLVVETAGGSIDLLQVEGPVKASTAAGRILAQFDAAHKAFSASQLETSMGDVYVYLPMDLRLTIDAAIDAAAGHQILSDFPIDIQGEKEEFVASTLRGHGALNGGGEILRIRSVAGNIEIHKLDARAMEELKSREAGDWARGQAGRAEREQRRLEREQERREQQRNRDEDRDQK